MPDPPPTDDRRTLLFTLWVFVMFNYVYGDILGLMDRRILIKLLEGNVDGIALTPAFLVGAAVLMQLPMLALLLTRLLPVASARWVNIVIAALKTMVVLGTLFMGSNTAYYLGYSVVEMVTTCAIVVVAWRWVPTLARQPGQAFDVSGMRKHVEGMH